MSKLTRLKELVKHQVLHGSTGLFEPCGGLQPSNGPASDSDLDLLPSDRRIRKRLSGQERPQKKGGDSDGSQKNQVPNTTGLPMLPQTDPPLGTHPWAVLWAVRTGSPMSGIWEVVNQPIFRELYLFDQKPGQVRLDLWRVLGTG